MADLCAAMFRPGGPACFLSVAEVELYVTRTYVARPGVDADGNATVLYVCELLIDRTRGGPSCCCRAHRQRTNAMARCAAGTTAVAGAAPLDVVDTNVSDEEFGEEADSELDDVI